MAHEISCNNLASIAKDEVDLSSLTKGAKNEIESNYNCEIYSCDVAVTAWP